MYPYPMQVILFRFPSMKMTEAVTLNDDDSYTVLIADWLDTQGQRKAFDHAMRHIENGDFYSEKSVQEIEYDAHKEAS